MVKIVEINPFLLRISMKKALLTWLGTADVKSLTNSNPSAPGPLKQVITQKGFNVIYIISNRRQEITNQCVSALKEWSKGIQIKTFQHEEFDPTDYDVVFQYTQDAVQSILPRIEEFETGLTFFATPGTPIMVAVLCLLAERIPKVSLIQSSEESGVKYIRWRIPDFLTQKRIKQIEDNVSRETPEIFRDLVFSSGIMWEKADQACRYAKYDVPVMLLGETGTGKEEFAKRIHKASRQRRGDFVPVNCGAIPPALIESILFGHRKGAFTGATTDRAGVFELANNGTIFLDEIGELPLEQQTKLLRVIQEKEVRRLGEEDQPRPINARIVTATHRNLQKMVEEGAFREDLFYRLAIAVITLPPLRERGQDIFVAADTALTSANRLIFGEKEIEYKKYSNDVKLFMSTQRWPGNFRELNSVVLRAVINASNGIITAQDIQEAMLDWGTKSRKNDDSFELPSYTSDGTFNLKDALGEVEKHYIELALKDAGGRIIDASHLLGITNYQTLTNRKIKYGL